MLLLTLNDIEYKRRSDIEHKDIESLWLEVKQKYKKPIIIVVLYCRSQKDVPDYLDLLSEIMDSVTCCRWAGKTSYVHLATKHEYRAKYLMKAHKN